MSTSQPITAEMFEQAVGRLPEQDDLERCNCERVGQVGHFSCGWDWERNLPNFMGTWKEAP